MNGKVSKQRGGYFTTECKVWLKRYLESREDTRKVFLVTKTNPIRRLMIPTEKNGGQNMALNGGHPFPFAIYSDEQPVGFVMLAYGITGYEEPLIADDNY